MVKEINRRQLEHVLRQITEMEAQHPKAYVFFDLENQWISITYPLPPDYWEIQKYGFNSSTPSVE